MAPLPDNNTNRLWVDYTTNGQAHSVLFRGKPGVLVASLVGVAEAFFSEVINVWYGSSNTTGARYSSEGSDFSLPVSFPTFDGAAGGVQPAERQPYFIGFSGRGVVTGRETNLRLFGTNLAPDGTYRIEPPIGLALDAIRDVLTGASAQLCTIGQDTISWRDYVNVGVDAYYQRKRRSG